MEQKGRRSIPEGSWVLLGLTRSGKTTLLFHMLDELNVKAVIVAPAVTNPRMDALDYVSDSEPEKFAEKFEESETHLLIEARSKDPEIFKHLEKFRVVVFDDVATYTNTGEMREAFVEFLRGVGWRHQFVIFTTHRITGDFKPGVLYLLKRAYFVGPIADHDEIKTLYRKSTVATKMDYDGFYNILRELKPYDWKRRNKDGYFLFYGA